MSWVCELFGGYISVSCSREQYERRYCWSWRAGGFARKKEIAWSTNDVLTLKGKEKQEEVMRDVHLCNLIVETKVNKECIQCKVKNALATSWWMSITVPLEEMGSRFGPCTCWAPRVMGVPCKHMVAAPKSDTIDELNKNSNWWGWTSTHQWISKVGDN